MERAVVVIDGEHYPPVLKAALDGLAGRFDVVGGIFAGGREKLSGESDVVQGLAAQLGLPRLEAVPLRGGTAAEALDAVRGVVRETRADVLADLSDEPIVGYRERFLLMSAALAEGATYTAADADVRPQEFARLEGKASLGVIGTGKRVGKTALSGWMARRLDRRLAGDGGVLVLAMGRGGPPEPELVVGSVGLGVAELLAASRGGRHAASDCFEDAALSRVTAVGCRRCGGGLAGAPFDDNVRAALPLVEGSDAELVIVEGSGAVVPPVACDAVMCVAGGGQDPDHVAGCLGTYRLLLSDVLALTQCEAPFVRPGEVAALAAAARDVNPDLEIVPLVFRPRPLQSVRGRRVAYFSTAPHGAAPLLARALAEEHGAEVVLVSTDLADRARLASAVARAVVEADVFLTELKAAAVDVVAEAAVAHDIELVLCDNEPLALEGDLGATADRLAALARERHAARTASSAPQGGGRPC
jgi:cyclic 2,3-diphosphoglycerate synthase